MKKIITSILAMFAILIIAVAQVAPSKYYIQFTDKDDSPFSVNDPSEYLSQRAIERRALHNIPIDVRDLPVNPQYLQAVRDAGAAILNPTKWLNGVTIETSNPAVIEAIAALPFVQGVMKSPVIPSGSNEKPFFMHEYFDVEAPAGDIIMKDVSFYDYGNAYNQIGMIGGDQIHELGYRGQGIVIGVLDSGFDNADELAIFDSLWNDQRVLATRDFVSGGPITFNKHYHGTMVLSTMAGNLPGTLVGTAPEASYLLLRTEDAGSEYLIEEYNWVSGAEYADSAGANVLNTSLGYSTFDEASQNHTYEDMDGNTTPITIGADIAASKGLIVVNSAGNSGGSSWYYITAPADGDSVFTIGAVNAMGIPASFSSHGPTFDGRIKPNVVAQGEGTYVASPDGSFFFGNGTSFSSPVIAGMMACLLQGNPDMNNMELINAVQESGSLAGSPDNTMGYGIPDFMAAHNILTVIDADEGSLLTIMNVYPNPFSTWVDLALRSEQNAQAYLSIADMTGRTVFEEQRSLVQGQNMIRINGLQEVPAGVYFLRLESGNAVFTTKLVKR